MKKSERGRLWYESLSEYSRRNLQAEFDLVYTTDMGNREMKFYQWLSDNFRFKL